jgi:hypothetical protein
MRRLLLFLGLLGLLAAATGVGPAGAVTLTAPVVVTGGATSITATTATVSGTVNPGGQATTYHVDYGITTTYGMMSAPDQSAGSGITAAPVSVVLSGLLPATTYHFRITATNASGPISSADATFTTAGAASTQTGPAIGVSATAATLTGTVNPAGVATSAAFEYGTTTAYGQTTPAQPVGAGTADVPVAAAVSGLAPATTYHYRVTTTSGPTTTPGADRTLVTPGTAVASTLAVTVNPAGADTDLAATLTIGSDPAGTPKGEALVVAQALSSDFASHLASFATCAAASFDNAQGPTAANCPDRTAIVGLGSLVTRGASGTDSTTDAGFLVKTAENRIAFWWHTPAAGTVPAGFGVVAGVVSQETGLYGPVVTYDLSGLPAGSRVKQFAVNYQRNATSGKAPFVAAGCPGGSWHFQARIVYRPGVGPELPATTVPCGVAAPQPSKLALARATITGRTIDILAPISRRASGNVSLELFAAGQRSRWTAAINSTDGRIRDTHILPASQARNGGTGILTIRYAGNAVTRPQVVRLRAGSLPAQLDASRPTLDATGHLRAHGTVSTLARGVVRVQLEYYSGGRTTTLERYATISGGTWNLDVTLTAAQQAAVAARQGPVESYILFTGYFPRRMRGEMVAYQVLGAP